MCISNNRYRAERVTFEDTILFGGVVRKKSGEIRHLLGYYNKVRTLNSDGSRHVNADDGDDFGWDIDPTPVTKIGNAMLFCVPAKPGTLVGKDNLIPVKDYPQFMQDYKRAVAPRETLSRGMRRGSRSLGASDSAKAVVVKGFDGGTYDVVIAPGGPKEIASVIDQVDPDKRPAVNEALYKELAIAYPGFTAVLFCFSESDAAKAGCALIEYEPMPKTAHMIFLPGLDGHNGEIERGNVELNHTLVFGHYDMQAGAGETVSFSDRGLIEQENPMYRRRSNSLTAPLPKRPYWALNRVIGRVIPSGTIVPQGDFWALVDDVWKGKLRVRRQVPFGWAKLPGKPADPAGKTPFYITESSEGPSAR